MFLLINSALTTKLEGQPFRFVVSPDGSGTHTTLQSAINDCPDNELSRIFIRKGVYNEQISIGTNTTASLKKISLIGEHPDSVIITGDKFRNSSNGLTFLQVVTFQVYATDFYAENITIRNTSSGNGQAEALYTGADRQTFKNVKLKGFQDTYRSKKGTRGYFKNCWIEGTVDFIYAGGVLFFDDCTIHCLPGGGYITAPEDAAFTIPRAQTAIDKFLRLGFIFRNCNITAAQGVANNSYFLGRPWNVSAGSFYLNCRLGSHIHPVGWVGWNGNETSSSFAEFRSLDSNGNPANITQRASWSFQLPEQDVNTHFTTQAVYARVSSTVFNPEALCVAPAAPANLRTNGNTLEWEAVETAAGYVVLRGGQYVGQTTNTHYTPAGGLEGVYTVKSVGPAGQLGEAAVITNTETAQTNSLFQIIGKTIYFNSPSYCSIYDLSGKLFSETKGLVSKLDMSDQQSGFFLLKITDNLGQKFSGKVKITHNWSF